MQLVKTELQELKEKYGDSRRTQIISKAGKRSLTEMMKEDESLVVLTHGGSVKRVSLSEYQENPQVIKPSTARDFNEFAIVSVNSHRLFFFTNFGKCYSLRTSFIPMSNGVEDAVPLSRLVPMAEEERVVWVSDLPTDSESFVSFGTRNGLVKRIRAEALKNVAREGTVVMGLKDGDRVVSAERTSGEQDLLMATGNGMAIRVSEQDVRDMGLPAGGVKGIELGKDDFVVGMVALRSLKSTLLTVTTAGYAKRSPLSEYSRIHRGGKGIINFRLSPKTGRVAAVLEIEKNEPILFVTRKGKSKKVKSQAVKVMGRATQGAPLLKVAQNDQVERCLRIPQIGAKNKEK